MNGVMFVPKTKSKFPSFLDLNFPQYNIKKYWKSLKIFNCYPREFEFHSCSPSLCRRSVCEDRLGMRRLSSLKYDIK